MTQLRLVVFLTLLTISGCDRGTHLGAIDETGCEGPTSMLTMTASRTAAGELIVEGVASVSNRAAIRTIVIEGHAARADAFNFSRFSVTIPRDEVPPLNDRGACETAEASSVCLVAEIEHACGEKAFEPMQVRVVGVRIEFERDMMDTASDLVLPADGSHAIDVELLASVSAQPTLLLEPATGSTGEARFISQRGPSQIELDATPSARTTVVGLTPGAATLTVDVSPEPPRRFLVTIAGPPTFTPDAEVVGASESLEILIESDAGLTACSVEAGTLTRPGTTAPLGADLAHALRVEATLTIASGATEAVVNCEDRFGQRAGASYQSTP